MIVSSGKRLSGMINEILDYSRMKYSNVELKEYPVDISQLIDLVINITQPLAEKKSILLRSHVKAGIPFAQGDNDRIQQVLINLVGNAVKFTDRGEILVKAELMEGNREMLMISVADTGIGIPESKHDLIFNSFEQADGSASRAYAGSGLGLAIAKKLIELQGGSIWVNSHVGKGSTFYFTLPVWDESKSIIQSLGNSIQKKPGDEDFERSVDSGKLPLPEMKSNGRKRERIMIVDDEAVNLQVLVNQLSVSRYEVLCFSHGEEALQLIDKGNIPDLILLDVMMPALSGYDLCRRIREKYNKYQLPIMMLTAKNNADDITCGLEIGANDYIAKPFEKNELLLRVNNLLEFKKDAEEQKQISLIQSKLSLARDIQNSIKVNEVPHLEGLEIESFHLPSGAVGGDFYDFYQIDEKCLGIMIADVNSHGVQAALIDTMLKILLSMLKDDARYPGKLMKKLNSILCNFAFGQFVSANYLLIDLEKRKIISANAGHLPTLVIKKSNEIVQVFNRGKVMGGESDIDYEEEEYGLVSGERIILFTDGVIESRGMDGKIFGEKNFQEMLLLKRNMPPGKFIEEIVEEIKSWTGERGFEDDMTIVVVDLI
jgi:two-component system sensor histidine kinase ChiS